MYHPGKIIEILSPADRNVEATDNSVQAMLEMWDENVVTVSVEPHLGGKVRKEDIVLVDYTTPKLTVIKVLRGTTAKNIWSTYKNHFNKRRTQVSLPRPVPRPKQEYVG